MSHHYRMGKNTTYSTRRLNLCQLSNETHAASLTQKLQNKSTQQNVTHTAEITIAKYRQYDRFFTTWVTIKKLIKLQNFYSITLKNNHENSGSLPRVSEHPLCQSVFEQDTESLPTSDLPIEEEGRKDNCSVGTIRVLYHPSVESLSYLRTFGDWSFYSQDHSNFLPPRTNKSVISFPQLLLSCTACQLWRPGVISILTRLTCRVSRNFRLAHLASVLQGP